jgi:iron complex transport system ATP-binding protein
VPDLPTASGVPAIELHGVTRLHDGRPVLRDVDWRVEADQRWVVLGRNGSGKTTLVRICALYDHPSSGTVRILREELGRCDVRALRRRIGFVSAAFADQIRGGLAVADVVMCGLNAALEPWWHQYDDEDRAAAREMLAVVGLEHHADQPFGTLSSGERQRALIARSLVTRPGLVLLDEPNAGLDLGGREELVADLGRLAGDPAQPPTVLVTHHVEEIPAHFDHVLALAGGEVLTAGPIDDVLDAEVLSECFGLPLALERRHGRWTAFRRP